MTCKLCLKEKTLIKKSHIIPDFMYKRMYDENGKLRMFAPSEYIKDEGYVRKPASGEYESELLCAECDNALLGGLEDYASKVMYNPPNDKLKAKCKNFKSTDDVYYSICENVDYVKFKLFLLSILWRSGISKRDFSRDVKLGPHQEAIRKMIFDNNAMDESAYPITMFSLQNDTQIKKEFILQPRMVRHPKYQHILYNFFLGQVCYSFHVVSSNHKLPKDIMDFIPKKNNSITVLHAEDGMAWEMIKAMTGVR